MPRPPPGARRRARRRGRRRAHFRPDAGIGVEQLHARRFARDQPAERRNARLERFEPGFERTQRRRGGQRRGAEAEAALPARQRRREGIELVVGDIGAGRHELDHLPAAAGHVRAHHVAGRAERDELVGAQAAGRIAVAEQQRHIGALQRRRLQLAAPARHAEDVAARRDQDRRPCQRRKRRLEGMGPLQPAGEIGDDRLDAHRLGRTAPAARPDGAAERGELHLHVALDGAGENEARGEGGGDGETGEGEPRPARAEQPQPGPCKHEACEPDEIDDQRNSGAAHPDRSE